MYRFILIFCLYVSATAFAQEKNNISRFFPSDNTFEGWAIKDSIESFSGDDLFYYINGGADIYLEFGFIQVAHCNYVNSVDVKIHLEVYEMEDNQAAFGIFTMNSSGRGKNISLGDEGKIYDYYLHYYSGNYYVRCTSSDKDHQPIEIMKKIGAFPSDLITKKGKKPALLVAIDMDDFQFTQIKYFEGQLGLSNVFNFGHGTVAGFKDGLSAMIDDKMLFVFSYENEYKCREWFASAKGKMQMSKKFSDYKVEQDGFIVKDKNGSIFSFNPYGTYYIVLKGYNWEEAQQVFEKITSNLSRIGK